MPVFNNYLPFLIVCALVSPQCMDDAEFQIILISMLMLSIAPMKIPRPGIAGATGMKGGDKYDRITTIACL
jgi:hypothetical protein